VNKEVVVSDVMPGKARATGGAKGKKGGHDGASGRQNSASGGASASDIQNSDGNGPNIAFTNPPYAVPRVSLVSLTRDDDNRIRSSEDYNIFRRELLAFLKLECVSQLITSADASTDLCSLLLLANSTHMTQTDLNECKRLMNKLLTPEDNVHRMFDYDLVEQRKDEEISSFIRRQVVVVKNSAQRVITLDNTVRDFIFKSVHTTTPAYAEMHGENPPKHARDAWECAEHWFGAASIFNRDDLTNRLDDVKTIGTPSVTQTQLSELYRALKQARKEVPTHQQLDKLKVICTGDPVYGPVASVAVRDFERDQFSREYASRGASASMRTHLQRSEAQSDDQLLLYVWMQLLKEEARQASLSRRAPAPASQMAVTSGGDRTPGLGLQKRDVPNCQHCGKRGHREEACWEKFPALMPEAQRQRREAFKLRLKRQREAPPAPTVTVLPAPAVVAAITDGTTTGKRGRLFVMSLLPMKLPNPQPSQLGTTFKLHHDSCASLNVTWDITILSDVKQVEAIRVIVGDGSKIILTQRGTLNVVIEGDPVTFTEVYLFDKCPYNIISIGNVVRKSNVGFLLSAAGVQLVQLPSRDVIYTGEFTADNLFVVDAQVQS